MKHLFLLITFNVKPTFLVFQYKMFFWAQLKFWLMNFQVSATIFHDIENQTFTQKFHTSTYFLNHRTLRYYDNEYISMCVYFKLKVPLIPAHTWPPHSVGQRLPKTHYEIKPLFESRAVIKILNLREIAKKSSSRHIINPHIKSFPTMYDI